MSRREYYDDCGGVFAAICSVFLFVVIILLAEAVFFLCQKANTPAIMFTALFSIGFIVMSFLTYNAVKDWRKQKNEQL